jgi:replication factor C subunit 2/4
MNVISLDFNKKKTKLSKKSLIDIKIPWIEKYRPTTSNQILLEPFIKEKIDNILKNKSIPNMIITGEPGTGKTSTIICLAKQLYDENSYKEYVLELNASDDRGLSIINNTILPFCKKKTSDNVNKLVILDEADSITTKAQNLLSNIIAEYKKNTRFVFICNNCSQITESIQSRCMIIKYGKINHLNLFNKIEEICKYENITYDINGINTLLFLSDYDIRQAINNLECIFYSLNILNEENIYKMIDVPKPIFIEKILNNCINGNLIDAINIVKELYYKGYTPNDILLTFMKCLIEDKFNNDNLLHKEIILKIYEIISLSYMRVNSGLDSLIQVIGCIAKIYLYLDN